MTGLPSLQANRDKLWEEDSVYSLFPQNKGDTRRRGVCSLNPPSLSVKGLIGQKSPLEGRLAEALQVA